MKDKCGLCDHFEREEGIFGACLVKESEHKDPATFSMDDACEYFTPNVKNKNQPISFIKHLESGRAAPPPHIAMFGGPSLLQAWLSNGHMFPSTKKPAGCNSCSDEENKEETKGWQNPVIRRKQGRKVVPWDEVKQRMVNRKQIGNTNL